ncbi:carboxypeptidase-like regulatory domain-containing protein [Hymenobacter sp. BT635]|uniref:Carboxypeptidase-like regulatory domain-containing protein n=1 Tax=Hymenobacter nitidus TaxID=2880929 RepID=A0ABS8A911_9BACT|nr:carboxypeptidase-like regulatory domain-containing protein [Hymenobacter nitidus]MCB2376890.1 carboxypeptidase-like regulatory domain-containing protein [Hymenobacter nitidus]
MPCLLLRWPLLLALFISCGARAQSAATGKVLTAAGTPVPFASVGIKGQPLGTVADNQGLFPLASLARAQPTDTVVISCIGYESRPLLLGQLRQQPDVVLAPAPAQIREVRVRHSKLTPATLGRTQTSGSAHWNTSIRDISAADGNRGWEVGTALPITRNSYVDSFHFYVEQNDFGPILLRFVLYTMQRGQPGTLLLTDDVQFIIPAQQTGWIDVDLQQYGIHLAKGQTVAAGIQWLQGQQLSPDKVRFGGPGAFPSPTHRALTRDKSQAPWRSFPINVSMYLAVQKYK